jgi:hypothetical protein
MASAVWSVSEYAQGRELICALSRINVIFAFDPTPNIRAQTPLFVNAAQNIKATFDASPRVFCYRFGAIAGNEALPLAAEYLSFADRLAALAERVSKDRYGRP